MSQTWLLPIIMALMITTLTYIPLTSKPPSTAERTIVISDESSKIDELSRKEE